LVIVRVALILLLLPATAPALPTPTPTATPVLMRAARAAAAATRTARRAARAAPLRAAQGVQASAVVLDPIPAPLVVGAAVTLTGSGFTAGSVIQLFVASALGTQVYGPFTPSAFTATTLDWTLAAAVQLGNGFGTVLVINTDQGFMTSNGQSQLLFGNAALNLPTITHVNGVALRPVDPTIPTANVETIVPQGTTLTVSGSGFNAPLVNLFTASGNVGPLTPLGGGTATQIQVTVPVNAPTGPGSLQVVNTPYTGNVLSNAVSVPIGAPIGITSITQNVGIVTVNGSGFSALTVINLFNLQGGGATNLGGLYATNGRARLPLTIVSPTQFTFAAPPGGIPGPAFVQALNPPFIPYTSTGNDPDGAFSMAVPVAAPGGASLRFNGTGTGDIDRVKIPLDAPARPVDVGSGNFTIEFWMKTSAGNASGSCVGGGDGWINGNILVDRDVFGGGDVGDFGISLFGGGGGLAFGLAQGNSGNTICGSADVADGAWHHVAAVRSGTTMRLFVDGVLDASGSGPAGDVSYRNGRATSWPDSDPFLVLGAEKHAAGAAYPSFHGGLDELRVSSSARYAAGFTPPSAAFTTDPATAALYHFDEGNGLAVFDTSLASGGPSHGARRVGGSAAWPQWSTDTPFASGTPAIALSLVTNALSEPTAIAHCGDNRLFIAQKGGSIRIWNGSQLLATPFLTIPGVSTDNERGLLGLAFHPQYAQNGRFFVNYTNAAGNTVIARYRVSGNPDVADAASAVTLRTIAQPAANHNGGQLAFGADGFLYVGMGDGGGSCDNAGATCNAQRDNSLLGKLLRLDVDQNVGTPPYYGIPAGNPFAGAGDPLDEIWAEGLRNPWRFTPDRLTGGWFIADVGQGSREEVSYQDRGSAGGENYGWKMMEGSQCSACSLDGCPAAPPCNSPLLTLPILEYTHALGCSITGGYVSRGTRVPYLQGAYLYGDLCSGRLWWAKQNGNAWTGTLFPITAGSLYTFGEDAAGELYVARGNGELSRIVVAP